ncbi:MAG: VCBS repeat-containing protein [Rhodocyclaceae bacterium]|nr:VCBS repeat-containing protein [Rhodocyclaceae bacterium]
MKIASAAIAMQSQHYLAIQDEQSQSLRAWTGPLQPDFAGNASSAAASASPVHLSAAGLAASSGGAAALQPAAATATTDPRLQLLIALLEWMTGKRVSIFDASQLQAPAVAPIASQVPAGQANQPAPASQSAGFGVEYDYHASHQEVEQTRFSAQGTINTADGRQIAFTLDVAMSRSYSEQTDASLRAGDGVRKDPLVINFGGAAAQLSSQHFSFDLNGDGQAENVPLLASGSGYLALDANHNGKIDSGAELFGPASGSGFAELAKYDQDGNGWIDENDPAFKQLQVWTPDASGQGSLSSLADHHVGALFLGHQGTAFELRGTQNQDLGAVRDSGVYLTESGQAGSLQQIDLTV